MCGKKNSVAQFPHLKRAFVEMSSPGLLFRAWDMAGFRDVTDFRMWSEDLDMDGHVTDFRMWFQDLDMDGHVTDFRIWFGTCLDMAYFAMLQI
jgi:hypothetical protein